jgi:hypothetical protein
MAAASCNLLPWLFQKTAIEGTGALSTMEPKKQAGINLKSTIDIVTAQAQQTIWTRSPAVLCLHIQHSMQPWTRNHNESSSWKVDRAVLCRHSSSKPSPTTMLLSDLLVSAETLQEIHLRMNFNCLTKTTR